MVNPLSIIEKKPLFSEQVIKGKNLDDLTLFERADLLRQAYAILDSGVELTEEEFEAIAEVEENFDNKIAAWGAVCQKIDEAAELCTVEADYYKAKAEEAKKRATVFNNKSNSMRESIKRKMIEFNRSKIKTPFFTVSLRKKALKPVDLGIAQAESSPLEFVRVKYGWDKKAIKEALEKGNQVEGWRMSDPDFSLTIK